MSYHQLLIGASGIYASYLVSSVLAEKLYSTQYPSDLDPSKLDQFAYPSFLVWFPAMLCSLFGYIRHKVKKEPPNPIPIKEQCILGLLYATNILCANYALTYISYLHQTIGRNCRYFFVVIVGALFSRVKKSSNLKLKPKKIILAMVVTAGVLLFTLFESKQKESSSFKGQEQWKGYALLIVCLLCDSFFSDSQAYSKANFHPTANQMFTSANFLTFFFVLLFSILKGEIFNQINFFATHRQALIDACMMAILQVCGQTSIYYVVSNFKQHIFPLISTTRRVFTVLLSILIYKHPVNLLQWLSISVVFAGLAYELHEEIEDKKEQKQKVK